MADLDDFLDSEILESHRRKKKNAYHLISQDIMARVIIDFKQQGTCPDFLVIFDMYPGVELLGNSMFIFWGTAILLSTVAAPFYIPTSKA